MRLSGFALGALVLAACSTTATPRDIDLTNAGVVFGVEACERSVFEGVPIDQAIADVARGRKFERYNSGVPGSSLTAPNWKLDGLVWAGTNQQGACDVIALSGAGGAARDAVVAAHLSATDRKWSRMRIVAAPEGETRDAVCAVDPAGEDRSVAVLMTSRVDSNVTMRRTFIATIMASKVADCTSRLLP
ncbi:MAG: hypothetical protein R3C46_03005 [Hyphomonadaceae bacterium]